MAPRTYAQSGVDIDRGERFTRFIKRIGSPAVSRAIGGFSGGFEIDTAKYRRPVLMSTTDGVGTKILVARALEKYDTIGIDLVAMCVNDLIVCGAAPASFLDYIAYGTVAEEILKEIMSGIVRGCEISGCVLSGGETAELPDMYPPGEIDLAGFACGIVDHDETLPKLNEETEGDVILGLPSVGIHSNGLSLARSVVPKSERGLWRELLRPTKIYVKELQILIETAKVRAAAHVTGGGLAGNLARVAAPGLTPRISYNWEVAEIFGAIQRLGEIEEDEMRRVFNMGIGVALVVAAQEVDSVLAAAKSNEIPIVPVGELVRG